MKTGSANPSAQTATGNDFGPWPCPYHACLHLSTRHMPSASDHGHTMHARAATGATTLSASSVHDQPGPRLRQHRSFLQAKTLSTWNCDGESGLVKLSYRCKPPEDLGLRPGYASGAVRSPGASRHLEVFAEGLHVHMNGDFLSRLENILPLLVASRHQQRLA